MLKEIILKICVLLILLSSSSANTYYYKGTIEVFKHLESNLNYLKLQNPTSTVFCISSDLDIKYKKASIYALEKASLIDGINLQYEILDNCSSKFLFTTIREEKSYNAINYFTYDEQGYITSSKIVYNLYHMDNYNKKAINYIALHELGHTLGLVDYQNKSNIGKSIMYYAYQKGNFLYDDYLILDKDYLKQLYSNKS